MKRFIWTKEKCKEEAKKYFSRNEFQKGSGGAYNAALRNNWLKDYDWFTNKFIWTHEKCYEEASKYSSRYEFCKRSKGAYLAALKNKWLDEFFGEKRIKENSYWTYERCFEEAKKYSSRSEFKKRNQSAYQAAKKKGWLDDYDWFKEVIRWTKEKCMREAKKYSSRNEFQKGNKSAYQAAKKKGWLDDYDWFKEKVSWTYERCRKEVSKYSSRSEFSKKNKSAYLAAWRNKWLDEFYGENNQKERGYWWNYKKCKEEASKYSSRNEFQKGNSSAYNAALKNGWLDKFFGEKVGSYENDHIYSYEFTNLKAVYVGRSVEPLTRDYDHRSKIDSVSSFAKKHNIPIPKMKILEDGITVKEGQIKEGIWLEKYEKEGWIIINKAPTGSIGNLAHKWTYEKCKEEAKKYSSRNEFCKNCSGAYHAALKNKWLDEFYGENNQKKSGYWQNYENCREEASKYSSRYEFCKENRSAYNVAKINGWLSEFYEESKRKKPGYWTYKTCKEEASKYSSRYEFKKGSKGAYYAAWENKWLDEFFPKSAPKFPLAS